MKSLGSRDKSIDFSLNKVASALPETLLKFLYSFKFLSAASRIGPLGSTQITGFLLSRNNFERKPVPEPISATECSGFKPQ